MSSPHGSFIWYELMTTDTGAAGRFYADVVGWTVGDFDGDVSGYRIFSAGEAGVTGMMALPADAAQSGMRPGWLGYIGVDNVDAAVASITAAGGAVRTPARDLPGVGRMAMVADPQGVAFDVMRGVSELSSTSFDADPNAIGRCGWNELATADPKLALDFYIGQFAWTKGDAMKMGEMGDYQFIHHAGTMIGGVMKCMPGGPPPRWGFYFRVADIDVAARRTRDGGGTIVHGPAEVPGGMHVLVATDPQGATFALVGKRAG